MAERFIGFFFLTGYDVHCAWRWSILITFYSLDYPIDPFAGHPSAFRKEGIQAASEKELPLVSFTISSRSRLQDWVWSHLSHPCAGGPEAVASQTRPHPLPCNPPISQLWSERQGFALFLKVSGEAPCSSKHGCDGWVCSRSC